ncbi:MAG: MmpS family transport accessory protein [Mycobacterium sp.]
MSSHLAGPSILFAIGVGVANVCAGVAHANDYPEVRYEVTGSSPVADYISYQTDVGQQHAVKAKLPWSSQFTGFGGQVFVISAQGPGSITCRILVDGRSVKEATATGTPARTVCVP